MDTQETTPKRRWPWGRIALIASLALNLLVVGIVLGAVLSGPDRRAERSAFSGLANGPYGRALSREDRRALGKVLREDRRAAPGNRREMRDIGLQLAAAIQADPFDPAAVSALMARQTEVMAGLQSRGLERFALFLSEMDPRERQAYGARLAEILQRGRKDR